MCLARKPQSLEAMTSLKLSRRVSRAFNAARSISRTADPGRVGRVYDIRRTAAYHPASNGRRIQPMEPNIVERAAQMFPRLTPAQIARIARVGHAPRRRAGRGAVRRRRAEHALLRRALAARSRSCARSAIAKSPDRLHGPGEFTGEINMLSARRSLVRGAGRRRRRGHRRRSRRPAHAGAARLRAERDPDARLHPAARRRCVRRGDERPGAARVAPLGAARCASGSS